MGRKAKVSGKRAHVKAKRAPVRKARPDALDDFIIAAAKALNLPAQKSWLPTIKANLRVTLQHAQSVEQFELPDVAEPAPVFKA